MFLFLFLNFPDVDDMDDKDDDGKQEREDVVELMDADYSGTGDVYSGTGDGYTGPGGGYPGTGDGYTGTGDGYTGTGDQDEGLNEAGSEDEGVDEDNSRHLDSNDINLCDSNKNTYEEEMDIEIEGVSTSIEYQTQIINELRNANILQYIPRFLITLKDPFSFIKS
jgi:hypothetical protein